MSDQAPIINVDRVSMNKEELALAEIVLFQAADWINLMTKRGAIYSQLILSPQEAQMKLAATQNGAQP